MNKLEELLSKYQNKDLPFEVQLSLIYVEDVNKFIKDTNLENHISIKDNLISFKVPARKLIRKYLDIILGLEGEILKTKISNLNNNEVIEFILSQSKRNAYNNEPDNAWQLKNFIKEFKGVYITFYNFYKITQYMYKSKGLYNFDIIEKIKAESYDL